MTATVYGLASTRDGKIRYIGQTRTRPETRLVRHVYESQRPNPTHPALAAWIVAENRAGFFVGVKVLRRPAIWNETEHEVIAAYRMRGVDLLNVRAGGESSADPGLSAMRAVLSREKSRYRHVFKRDRV